MIVDLPRTPRAPTLIAWPDDWLLPASPRQCEPPSLPTKANKPYVVAGAVVGVTRLQSVILRGIVQVTRRRLAAKSTRAEAMEWLASEAKLDSTTR